MMVIGFSILLMAAVVALLSIRIIFKKGAKFPDSHISNNKGLRARGITCATSMDRIEHSENRPRYDFKKFDEAVKDAI